ncbi:MAG: hypothetical protein LBM25_07775 [Bacteroidales bacterium]|jgi:hypothetical protein|nr:hypothetical protein [Bacteroidales bacterium]
MKRQLLFVIAFLLCFNLVYCQETSNKGKKSFASTLSSNKLKSSTKNKNRNIVDLGYGFAETENNYDNQAFVSFSRLWGIGDYLHIGIGTSFNFFMSKTSPTKDDQIDFFTLPIFLDVRYSVIPLYKADFSPVFAMKAGYSLFSSSFIFQPSIIGRYLVTENLALSLSASYSYFKHMKAEFNMMGESDYKPKQSITFGFGIEF